MAGTDDLCDPASIEETLKRSAAALRDADIDFALAGSLAAWARGGPETRHDLDFFVRPEDAEQALAALAAEGMRPERPPEGWLLKAWDGDILVDLIFQPSGLDAAAALERAEELTVSAQRLPVITLEDLLVTKLMSLDEHRLDYESLLPIARALRERIDWEAVRAATWQSPFSQAFFTLLEGLGVIDARDAVGAPAREA